MIRARLRAATVALPPVVTIGMLFVLGTVLGWPVWFYLVGAAALIAVAFGVVVVVRDQSRHGQDRRRRAWAAAGLVIVMAATSLGTAATVYRNWTSVDARNASDRDSVAEAAYAIAGPLTSITPRTQAQYLPELRPLMTAELAQAFETNFLNRMPADTPSKASTVRSVSVEAVVDGEASVIAVVERKPPDPASEEPSDLILWLLLGRHDGTWYLANLAPLLG